MTRRAQPGASSEATEPWAAQFKRVSRARKLRFVAGTAYQVNGVYLAQLSACHRIGERGESHQRWRCAVKPVVLDDILWEAFLPGTDLGGPRAQLNLKVSGAFTVDPLAIGEGVIASRPDGTPDAALHAVIDEFESLTQRFIARYPTVSDYFVALSERVPESERSRGQHRLREIVTLIAADRTDEAAALADSEIARGETGPYSGSILASQHYDGVFQHLALMCKPAQASADYLASRTPTHRYQILAESDGYHRDGQLAHGFTRHRQVFGLLRDFTGTSPWGMILTPLPDAGNLRYLQAAGRADAMTLEICIPQTPPGSISSRFVIGHDTACGAEQVAIELPYSTETVSSAEVFTAEEAIAIFENYYDTGDIDPCYRLRQVAQHPNRGPI